MKKLILTLFFICVLSIVSFGQTERYLMMVRGDTKAFGFRANRDYSDKEVSFVVKMSKAISAPRFIWKRNALAGGDSSEIYISGRDIMVYLDSWDTADLTARDYFYDIEVRDPNPPYTTTTIFTGTFSVWADLQTPYDGIVLPGTPIRVLQIAVDEPEKDGMILTWSSSDSKWIGTEASGLTIDSSIVRDIVESYQYFYAITYPDANTISFGGDAILLDPSTLTIDSGVLTVIGGGGGSGGLFQEDGNGDLMPAVTGGTDNYYELDSNGDIQPI